MVADLNKPRERTCQTQLRVNWYRLEGCVSTPEMSVKSRVTSVAGRRVRCTWSLSYSSWNFMDYFLGICTFENCILSLY